MSKSSSMLLLLLIVGAYVVISTLEDQWNPSKWFDDESESSESSNDETVGKVIFSNWGDCSKTCGGGIQTRTQIACVDPSNNDNVWDDSKCTPPTAEETQQKCNENACDIFEWVHAPWTNCTKACGTGKQTRPVSCVNQTTGTLVYPQDTPSDVERCTKSKPQSERECNTQSCPTYYWSSEPSNVCSAPCGGGTMDVDVKCMSSDGTEQDETKCSDTKPDVSLPCGLDACPTTCSRINTPVENITVRLYMPQGTADEILESCFEECKDDTDCRYVLQDTLETENYYCLLGKQFDASNIGSYSEYGSTYDPAWMNIWNCQTNE